MTSKLNFPWDFKAPDYAMAFRHRVDRLNDIRADPAILPVLKAYYRENPAQFIIDWAVTSDPRNPERGLPVVIPFLLFPKQIEWVDWIIDAWKNQRPGLTEKGRDIGMSWLSMALSCTLCLFNDGMVIGMGSRKEELVDKIGDPKSLFYKGRMFLRFLPKEFRGGWIEDKHSPHMRIIFPETGSAITGEAGDNIGRGARASIYFIDESAYVERSQLIDASLSATTNSRQDISTPNGLGNSFAQKRHGGNIPVFSLTWRDDPRKDDAWYAKKCLELDPVTIAQEIDVSYSASVDGVVIPSAWVSAAIDCQDKLHFRPTGIRTAALDVSDTGADLNAISGRYGVLLERSEAWSGKGSDTHATAVRAMGFCETHDYARMTFDSDGIGAAIRGDARVINEARVAAGKRTIPVDAYRGSAAVMWPESEMIPGRKNEDYFANFKAQAWWSLRERFKRTHAAVVDGLPYDEDEIISISSRIPDLNKIIMELSQPTYSMNSAGKMLIDKAPDGTRSPNYADSIVMLFSPTASMNIRIDPNALRMI